MTTPDPSKFNELDERDMEEVDKMVSDILRAQKQESEDYENLIFIYSRIAREMHKNQQAKEEEE